MVTPAPSVEDEPRRVAYGEPAGRWVLLATVLGSAMVFIDGTVVNVALPRIGASLGADAAGLQWTVNGYTLTLAALILLGGSLGDRFGRRRIFVLGALWFGAASLLCALAIDVRTLVAARAIQGVGGALLTPAALAILETSFRSEDRSRAVGAWSGLGGLAGAVAPFLGGWLLDVATWRLVFLINVPLAVAVAVVAVRHVPETRGRGPGRRVDLAGVACAAAGLGGLTYGLTAWGSRGGASSLPFLLLGVAGLGAFVVAERRASDPMLPLRLFGQRAFAAANAVTFALYAALGGALFFVPLQLQVVAARSPVAAGAALLPITALMLLLSARAGALGERVGPRWPMTLGPLACAVALALLSRVGADASYGRDVLPGVVLLGLGLSLVVAPLTTTALGSAGDRHAGVASGVNNAVARVGGLLAVAALPLAAGLRARTLTDPAALAPTYRTAMLLCAGLMLAAALVAVLGVPARRAPARAAAPLRPRRYHCAVLAPPLEPGGGSERA